MQHNNKSFWWYLKRTLLFLFIFQFFYIIILKWVYPPVTLTQLHSWITGDGLKRDYVPASKVSKHFKVAVIASEDQLFAEHGGFDWKHIKKAMDNNEKRPKKIKGASTISQQVAKNVFLWQGRSWIRKGLEVYFTKMIEWIWGKERILDVYVNVIETGKGVFGIQAASKHFFKKDCNKLSRREASMIAASLPNPSRFTVKPVSKHVAVKSRWIQTQMPYLEKKKEIMEIVSKKD